MRAPATCSFLHLIVAGQVALYLEAGGQMLPIQTLHPGEAMGWSSVSASGRAHFRGRALTKHLLELVTERLDSARMQLFHKENHDN